MIKRTVEISTNGCYLHTKNDQLVIEKDGDRLGSLPIEDLGVVIFDSPQLTLSASVIRNLAENNVAVIFTDSKHLPSSLTIPFSANSIQTKILNAQIGTSLPVKKRLWSAIISAKIENQARSLELCKRDGNRLLQMSRRIKSGDPENIEAQAAKIYWRKLFGDGFRRDREAPDANALLNYGYAIVRAAAARAIVGTGLHPGLGINHKNQYNPFPLADDLVEPLRPLVDLRVFSLINESTADHDGSEKELRLDKATKQELLSLLGEECLLDGRKLPLLVALSNYAASIKQVMTGETDKPVIPTL